MSCRGGASPSRVPRHAPARTPSALTHPQSADARAGCPPSASPRTGGRTGRCRDAEGHRAWRRPARAGYLRWSCRPLPRPQEIRLDEGVEVAIHDGLDVANLQTGAMVLDELVRVERVRADLAAERDLLLVPGQLGQLIALLFLGDLVEARLEDTQRGVPVAELRTLVLTLDDEPRRQVRDSHGGVRRIDALPSRARRAKDVDPQIVLADADFDVVDLGSDGYRCEARLASARGVERRDPHEPVHAGLSAQIAVGVDTGDLDRDGLDSGFFTGQQVDDFGIEAGALTPSQVHSHEHL